MTTTTIGYDIRNSLTRRVHGVSVQRRNDEVAFDDISNEIAESVASKSRKVSDDDKTTSLIAVTRAAQMFTGPEPLFQRPDIFLAEMKDALAMKVPAALSPDHVEEILAALKSGLAKQRRGGLQKIGWSGEPESVVDDEILANVMRIEGGVKTAAEMACAMRVWGQVDPQTALVDDIRASVRREAKSLEWVSTELCSRLAKYVRSTLTKRRADNAQRLREAQLTAGADIGRDLQEAAAGSVLAGLRVFAKSSVSSTVAGLGRGHQEDVDTLPEGVDELRVCALAAIDAALAAVGGDMRSPRTDNRASVARATEKFAAAKS